MSNRMDQDQVRRFVGPDLGPNCLQTLSADDTWGKELTLDASASIMIVLSSYIVLSLVGWCLVLFLGLNLFF